MPRNSLTATGTCAAAGTCNAGADSTAVGPGAAVDAACEFAPSQAATPAAPATVSSRHSAEHARSTRDSRVTSSVLPLSVGMLSRPRRQTGQGPLFLRVPVVGAPRGRGEDVGSGARGVRCFRRRCRPSRSCNESAIREKLLRRGAAGDRQQDTVLDRPEVRRGGRGGHDDARRGAGEGARCDGALGAHQGGPGGIVGVNRVFGRRVVRVGEGAGGDGEGVEPVRVLQLEDMARPWTRWLVVSARGRDGERAARRKPAGARSRARAASSPVKPARLLERRCAGSPRRLRRSVSPRRRPTVKAPAGSGSL